MKLTQKLLLVASTLTLSSSLIAQTFVFGSNSGGGQAQADLDGLSSGSTISGGLTLTASASSGSFNSTSGNGFGINATGSDATAQFDLSDVPAPDVMTFSFDKDVTFTSISLSLFGASDEAFLTIGATTITIDSGSFSFAPGLTLAANTNATFGHQAGNGFQLESLTVVPEPNTYAMLAGFCALGFVMLKRRRS